MGGTGGFIRRCERLQEGGREGQATAKAKCRSFGFAVDDETVNRFAQDDKYLIAGKRQLERDKT
jgi:hypothetical protein